MTDRNGQTFLSIISLPLIPKPVVTSPIARYIMNIITVNLIDNIYIIISLIRPLLRVGIFTCILNMYIKITSYVYSVKDA
jgi:hypothetical protein